MQLGTTVAGRYVIDGELGRGGMGVVFSGHDAGRGVRVAIKTLASLEGESPAENAKRIARFEREARIVAGLSNRHIAKVFDVVRTEAGAACIVMEYLAGETLTSRLRKASFFAPEEALRLLRQVCLGVGEAHRAEIVHRDLKPSNIFLLGSGDDVVAKVLDFGVAKVVGASANIEESTLTAADSLIGSPSYMSPEQVRGLADLDVRSDIWSLGVVLYEMLTGRRPFVGATVADLCLAVLAYKPARLTGLAAVDDRVVAIVERCLQKDRAQRFADADALIAAIDDALIVESSNRMTRRAAPELTSSPLVETGEPAPVSRRPTPPSPEGRRWIGAALATLLMMAIVTISFARLQGRTGLGETSAPVSRAIAAAPPASLSSPAPDIVLAAPSIPTQDRARPVPVEPLTLISERQGPAAPAVPTQVPLSPRRRPSLPRGQPPAVNCEVPVAVDANGHRTYRRECL